MRVFLTGGTGLLGSHVAERLRRSRRHVTALVRPGSPTAFLEELGCDLVPGHVGDAPEIHQERMSGCDGLVHAAAKLYGADSLSDAAAVNVLATEKVLEGAERAGVTQAVYLSSVAVYGNAPGPMTEDQALDHALPEWDYYGRTKRAAEGVARRFHRERELAVTVLRPPALYGERDRWMVPKMLRLLRRRFVPLPNGGTTVFPAVYAGNLAQAVEAALEGRASGEVVNVVDDLHLTLRQFLDGLAKEVGLRPRFVNVPRAVAAGAATVLEVLGGRVPGARGLSLRRTVRLASEENPYSSEKARSVLGWNPPFTFDEAMERTGSWIRERNTPNGSEKRRV